MARRRLPPAPPVPSELSLADAQEKFLTAFVESNGDLEQARKSVGLTRSTFYTWLRTDQIFRDRFDSLRVLLVAGVENEAIRRVLNPDGQRGSDALVNTVLKGLKPERYRDDNKGGPAVSIVYVSGLRDTPRPGAVSPPELPAVRAEPITVEAQPAALPEHTE